MSGVSLATKGMICRGGIQGAGTMGRPPSESIVEAPMIHITKVKTKVIKTGIDLEELEKISFKVEKVLSSY
jgi:hypothetical protein